jgi:hypothetical protein
MPLLSPLLRNWNQVTFNDGSDAEVFAPALSEEIVGSDKNVACHPRINVNVALDGDPGISDITMSLKMIDGNDVVSWSPPQTQEVRVNPEDEGGFVVGVFSFSTLRAASVQISFESTLDVAVDPAPQSTAKVYYAFQAEP